MSKISVIGAGYVGLVTAACFAEVGHQVTCIEIDSNKLLTLERGELPIHEPGLADLWRRHKSSGRLRVTGDYKKGLTDQEFAFIAVGTPSSTNGKPDLSWVRSAAKGIARQASSSLIVVIKSTVPVGTNELVADIIASNTKAVNIPVVSNPEFLREGLAVFDFFNPTRVVVGAKDYEASKAVAALYRGLECPVVFCDPGAAEMSKYVSNAFLASRISFANEIALLCDKLGVDVKLVTRIVGMDPRCGNKYFQAGLGFGGSCLPKDLRALIHMAEEQGVASPLLQAIWQVNRRQPLMLVDKLQRLLGDLNGKTVGILGLAFKPNSDDMREASSLNVISLLLERGCHIKAYDPMVTSIASKFLSPAKLCTNAYDVAAGSDALILVTDWDEFKHLDMERVCSSMKKPVLVDGRNLYDPEEMRRWGFAYEGVGRNGTCTDELQISQLRGAMFSGSSHENMSSERQEIMEGVIARVE